MSSRLAAIVAVIACAGPTAAVAAPAYESTYTRHDFERCPEATSPEPGVIMVRTCAGYGGIAVMWTSEPDSSWVGFGERRRDEPMKLGADFFEAGSTIEWRGPRAGGGIRPVVAIVRYTVGRSVGRKAASRLVLYRLEPGGSCIMATAATNQQARALADRHAAGFACGQSPRIGR